MNEKINNKLTGNSKPITARQSRGKLSRKYQQSEKAMRKRLRTCIDYPRN